MAQSLDPASYEIMTASAAAERAARVLPTTGSEDVSSRLIRPKREPRGEREPDDGPDEEVEWVIDLSPAQADGVFKRGRVLEVFDGAWRGARGNPRIYGRAREKQQWTYVIAGGDAPEDYDRLALGVDLAAVSGSRPTETTLTQIAAATDVAARRLGAGSTTARRSAKAGAEQAERLEALKQELEDVTATIVLEAPEGVTFDGKAIWDVMLCLGLRWGDLDLFHWESEDPSRGDDHLFSVFTGTEPGYFLPEQIAAGLLQVRNLIFEVSIPRSADPEVVVEAMLVAAAYARQRLGGALLDGHESELRADALRQYVKTIAARLVEVGLPAGHDTTRRIL